jgi:transposase InsO family protein
MPKHSRLPQNAQPVQEVQEQFQTFQTRAGKLVGNSNSLDVRGAYNADHGAIIGLLRGTNDIRTATVRQGSQELRELYGSRGTLREEHGLLYKTKKNEKFLYVPASIREQVLRSTHDTAHLGADKMHGTLRSRYWWPSMKSDISKHVGLCSACLRTRSVHTQPHAPLQIFSAAARFELVHIDILGGGASLPVSKSGNKYILVMIDHFSKFGVAAAMPDQRAETVAETFLQHWCWKFGAPQRLHSDQGPNFESALFQEMCRRMHISKSRTLTYHPQSNGAVERLNRSLLTMLRALCVDKPKTWDDYVGQAMFAYNSSPHRSTGVTPYLLMHGEEARLPAELVTGSPRKAESPSVFVQRMVRRMATASAAAQQATSKAQKRAKDYYDANVNSQLYKVGQIVYIVKKFFPRGWSKLSAKWEGPCTVLDVRNVQALVLCPDKKTKWVHHNRLSAPIIQDAAEPTRNTRAQRHADEQWTSGSGSSADSDAVSSDDEQFPQDAARPRSSSSSSSSSDADSEEWRPPRANPQVKQEPTSAPPSPTFTVKRRRYHTRQTAKVERTPTPEHSDSPSGVGFEEPSGDEFKTPAKSERPVEVPTAPSRQSNRPVLQTFSPQTPPKPLWTGESSDDDDDDESSDDSDDLELSSYESSAADDESNDEEEPDDEDRPQLDQQKPDLSGLAEFPARPLQRKPDFFLHC